MFDKLTARVEGKPIDARPASDDRGGFWRSLDEMQDAEVFRDYITERFPRFAAHLNVDRREFLKLMSASLALAGMGACSREPQEKIVPYVNASSGRVAGPVCPALQSTSDRQALS